MEFNPDGSIKLSPKTLKNKETEKNNIVLRRVQLSTKPAIAQLKIEFPDNSQRDIISHYNWIKNNKFQSVEHNLKQEGNTYIIEVKGSKFMYSFLEFMIQCYLQKYETDKPVLIRGSWDNFKV